MGTAAAPYTQQTSFGQPPPLLSGLQTSVPHTWTALPTPQAGQITSPEIKVAGFNELVPSWNVTGGDTHPFTLEVRIRQPGGTWSPYFCFGVWQAAAGRRGPARRPGNGGWVDTDTLKLPYRATAFQFRARASEGQTVKLLSFSTSDTALRLQQAGATPRASVAPLAVPGYSQVIYPDGGEVWCSPTSVSMLLAYWGNVRAVPLVAQATFDQTYDGFGNWPFNTAYAATQGMQAFVTRLGSLNDAEAYLQRGIPLAVTVRFKAGELPGAPLSWSNGHVLVLTGSDGAGYVFVNDPAAPGNSTVKRRYPRAVFERLWLSHAGGLAYVVVPGRPQGTP
jgi:hypothetical protein